MIMRPCSYSLAKHPNPYSQFCGFGTVGRNPYFENVPEMLEAGVLVGLGVDNIADFYEPFVDGDMWVELRLMQEACRYYNLNALVQIASKNGANILDYK